MELSTKLMLAFVAIVFVTAVGMGNYLHHQPTPTSPGDASLAWDFVEQNPDCYTGVIVATSKTGEKIVFCADKFLEQTK